MPLTSSIANKLKKDLPDINFIKGDAFRWSPSESIIYYQDSEDTTSLLHEVAHALLRHTAYNHDVELLAIEREAWNVVTDDLSKRYDVQIDKENIEITLDTYRDWLHSRSLCPTCEATGIQKDKNHYICLACDTSWRVNEAKTCALRRYKTK